MPTAMDLAALGINKPAPRKATKQMLGIERERSKLTPRSIGFIHPTDAPLPHQ